MNNKIYRLAFVHNKRSKLIGVKLREIVVGSRITMTGEWDITYKNFERYSKLLPDMYFDRYFEDGIYLEALKDAFRFVIHQPFKEFDATEIIERNTNNLSLSKALEQRIDFVSQHSQYNPHSSNEASVKLI